MDRRHSPAPHRNPTLVGFAVFWAALWLGQVVIGRAVLHYDISWPEVLLGGLRIARFPALAFALAYAGRARSMRR